VDNTLAAADVLLRLQAAVNARLVDLSWLLSKRDGIKSVVKTCDVRRYQDDQTYFEACVDVETKADVSIAFWLEFGSQHKRWRVEAAILRTTQEGQDRLAEHPEAWAANLLHLEGAVTEACGWLVERGNQFNFAEVS
jgi:hypothetical protein